MKCGEVHPQKSSRDISEISKLELARHATWSRHFVRHFTHARVYRCSHLSRSK